MPYTSQPTGTLADVVQRIYDYADEPSVEAKYTTDKLFPLITQAYSRVMMEHNSMSEHPIVVRWSLTVTESVQNYYLPPNVGQLLKIGKVEDVTGRNNEWTVPRSRLNPYGPGVLLEGNMIRWEPKPRIGETLQLEYIPDGYCSIHLGTFTQGDTVTPSDTTFALNASPSEGYFDQIPNAYLGQVVRIIDCQTTGSVEDQPTGYTSFPIQERPISGYAPTTNVITVEPAFDFNLGTNAGIAADSTYTYEVVPFFWSLLKEAVIWDVVRRLHGISGKKQQEASARIYYIETMRNIRMNAANYNQRTGSSFKGDMPGITGFGRLG